MTLYTQPQGAPRLNPSVVSDYGIVALFNCANGIELISGAFSSARTSAAAVGSLGRCADFSGSANQQWAHRPSFVVLGDISIIALMEIDAANNYIPVISKQSSSTTNCPYEMRVSYSGVDTYGVIVRANGSGYAERYGNTSLANTGVPSVIVVTSSTLETTGGASYCSTKIPILTSLSFSTNVISGGPTDNGSSSVWIGRRSDGATQLDGRIYYVALCNKQISADQARGVISNPWSLFADDSYLDVAVLAGAAAGTGGGTNHSLTATNLTGSAPSLGSAALTQAHSITATGITGTVPTLGSPALSQNHVVTASNLTGTAAVLGSPSLSSAAANYSLTATAISGSSAVVGTPALTQNHVVVATGVTGAAPALGTPTLSSSGDTYALLATALSGSAAALGSPGITQNHVLATPNPIVIGAPTLGHPSLSGLPDVIPETAPESSRTWVSDGVRLGPSSPTPPSRRIGLSPADRRSRRLG